MADLTLTTTIKLTDANGNDNNITSKTYTITGVTENLGGNIDVTNASEQIIYGVGTAGLGALAAMSLLYIENLHASNFCRIRLNKNGAETLDMKLPAGGHFLFYTTDLDADTGEGAFSAFVQYDEIKAQFDTAAGTLLMKMYST